MTVQLWLAFVAASAIMLIMPGPTILTVISYSVAHGKRATLPLIMAVALGDSTALLLSLAGLGAVLASSAWLFGIIKWIGGLYLIWLGISMLRSAGSPIAQDSEASTFSPLRLFGNTWLVTALNPKGIIFFIAFLPLFVNADKAVGPQLWLLSLTFVVLASLNATLYALFANQARKLLSSPAAQRRFRFAGAGLLTFAGGWALTARQSA